MYYRYFAVDRNSNSLTKVTVVTPSYNQGAYLDEAIQSIISQRRNNYKLQYVIKDNCSSDNTPSILHSYSFLNDITIRVERDSGQSDALSQAFDETSGDILCWLNSDDVLLPGALEATVKLFDQNPDIDVVYGDALFIDKEGYIVGPYPSTEFDSELLFCTCFLSQPSVFFRRSLYEKSGGLDKDLFYCLDYSLWIRFIKSGGKFYHLKRFLSATRIYSETKTASGGLKFVDEIHQMLFKELGHIPKCWKLYKMYSKSSGFKSNTKSLKFIEASLLFFLSDPFSVKNIYPWILYLIKHKLIRYLRLNYIPIGKHYSEHFKYSE